MKRSLRKSRTHSIPVAKSTSFKTLPHTHQVFGLYEFPDERYKPYISFAE